LPFYKYNEFLTSWNLFRDKITFFEGLESENGEDEIMEYEEVVIEY